MLKYGCSDDAMRVYILGAFALNTIHGAFYWIGKPETAKEAFDAFLCNAVLFCFISIGQCLFIGGIVLVIGLYAGIIH